MSLPNNPQTRKEMYLSNMAGQGTALPSEPITREEEYLDYIAKNGGGGGGTGDGDMKKSVYDGDLAVASAGGIADYVAGAITGKVDKVQGKGLSTNDYDDSAKAIVDGVTTELDGKVSKSNTAGLVKNDGTIDTTTTGAVAANTSAISAIKDGTNIDSFGDVETALATKVDKVAGKGLSTNDYDDTEKAKVAGAFPRSEQAVLGAGNLLDKAKATGVSADVEVTQTTTGVRGVVANASTWRSISIIMPNVVKNYGLTLASNVEITSGQALLKAEGFDGTTFTPISESSPITTSGRLKLTFNTGSYPYLRIQLYVTGGASANTGDITYNDLCLSTDTDPTYAPYAMTNRELTEIKSVDMTSASLSLVGTDTGNSYIRKWGHMVDVNLSLSDVTVEGDGAILALPAEYKPYKMINSVLFNTSDNTMSRLYVDNGVIRSLLPLTSKNIRAQFSYMV